MKKRIVDKRTMNDPLPLTHVNAKAVLTVRCSRMLLACWTIFISALFMADESATADMKKRIDQ